MARASVPLVWRDQRYAVCMAPTRYAIRVGSRSRLFLRIFFGVTSERAWVELDDSQVSARFGWYSVRLPFDAIESWRIEGPWRWVTAIGVRRSIRHGDVSFAGSPRGGVRLELRRPIRWTIFDVPAFYLGVDDLDGLAAALSERGIPGTDARTG